MRAGKGIALGLCLTTICSIPLSAQRRLFVFGSGGNIEVNLDSGALRARPDLGAVFYGAVQLFGGRLFARLRLKDPLPSTTYVVDVTDPRSGATASAAEFPVGGYDSSSGPAMEGDPNGPRVFVWHLDTIASLSSDGARVIATATPALGMFGRRLMTYAPGADLLFVAQQRVGYEIAQYDPAGSLIRAFSVPIAPTFLAVTADATRVFAAFNTTGLTFEAVSYDARTGQPLASAELLRSGWLGDTPAAITLDEPGQRVLVTHPQSGYVEVRDYELTMQRQLSSNVQLCRLDLLVDDTTGFAVAALSESYDHELVSAARTFVALANVGTGRVLASAQVASPPIDSGALAAAEPCC